MCRRPHHRVVSMAIVDRVIARRGRSAIAGCLDPPRDSEPREVDPQDSESRDLNQAAVRLRVLVVTLLSIIVVELGRYGRTSW